MPAYSKKNQLPPRLDHGGFTLSRPQVGDETLPETM
jgi:hypothetical protein